MSAAAIIAAIGSIRKGVAGFEAGKYNAAVARVNARLAESEGAETQAAIRREARAAMGQALAAQGTSGFQLGTGSALDVLTESALNAELNAMAARRAATIKGQGLRADARFQSRAATQALISGYLGAGDAIHASTREPAGASNDTGGGG